jgi:phosphoglycolate phosphatase
MSDFPFDLVGFDLDGTLLDTAPDLGHALNHVLTGIGRTAIPANEVRSLIGGGTGQMLRGGLARTGGIDEAAFDDLTARLNAWYADNIANESAFYPGTEAMLRALQARGVKLAVATNKREALARRLLDAMGLTPHLATILGGDTLGLDRAKPHPDLLLEMIHRTGAQRVAFVGDTTYDVRAARAAGLPVVAVSFGYCDRLPHELGADAVIDHFDALIPTLEHLGRNPPFSSAPHAL